MLVVLKYRLKLLHGSLFMTLTVNKVVRRKLIEKHTIYVKNHKELKIKERYRK